MPLTPQFEIRQDDTQVYVTIWVPAVRLDAMEVVLAQQDDEETSNDDYNTSSLTTTTRRKLPNVLHFYAAPCYLLKLNFAPYAFLDDNHQEASAAQYDPASQKVTVPLIKAIPGVHWENLELTARLLQPTQISKQWLHAVVRNDDDDDDDGKIIMDDDEEDDDTNNDTPKNKTEATTTASSTEKNQCCDGYGYGGIFQNIFTDYCRGGLAAEMLQLSDPETTPAIQRRQLRQTREEKDFDAERYMGDFDLSSEEDYMYPMVLEFQPFWNSDKDSLTIQMEQLSVDNDSQSNAPIFTSEERLQLATIPYPLLPLHLKHIDDTSFWPQVLDLLIPYVYDHLTTLGDSTVESAWTISTLSCSLSWLDVPTCVEDVIFQTSRRMLIYPYWRNLDFVVDRVLAQTLQLLEAGSHAIIKALLQIRSILEQSESYYVGNKIFVDPILYVIQQRPSTSTPSKVLQAFSQTFQKGVPYIKARLQLDLESIERMYLQGDEEVVSDATSTSSSSDDDDDDDTDSSKDEEDTAADVGTDDTFERPPLLLDSLVGSADQTRTSSSMLLLDQQTNTSNTTTNPTSSGESANIAAESTARPKGMIEIMEST